MMNHAIFDLFQLDGRNGFTISNTTPSSYAGFAVVDDVDVDGDGLPDLILGGGSALSEQVHILRGAALTLTENIVIDDLDPQEFVTLSTSQPYSGFGVGSGLPIAAAGDVNNDGFEDILIGASNQRRSAGVSYLLYGSENGIDPTLNLSRLQAHQGVRILGVDNFDGSGSAVSGIGDINGDGIDDIAIHAPYASNYAGSVYIVFGSQDNLGNKFKLEDLNGRNGFQIEGMDQDIELGSSIRGVGDINHDGIQDLIVGSNSSRNYLIYGRSDPFESVVSTSALTNDGYSVLQGFQLPWGGGGTSVDTAGDFNGDGIDDLVIGSGGNGESGEGITYLIYGKEGGIGAQLDVENLRGDEGFSIVGSHPYDRSGAAVAGGGDFNGDGLDDVIIGASGVDLEEGDTRGAAYVIYGKPEQMTEPLYLSNLNGQNGFRIEGDMRFERLGISVRFVGDLNGDGFDDINVGRSFWEVGALERTSVNRGYIIYGKASEQPEVNSISGTPTSERLLGGREKDLILGRQGDDTLRGNAQDDTLKGGVGNDRLRGNTGHDLLVGGAGDDCLSGGAGLDRLIGGQGADTLSGGSGADHFVFRKIRTSADQILDFDPKDDVIVLQKSGFNLDVNLGELFRGRFTVGSLAKDAGDRIIYNDQTGALLFDADGSRAVDAVAIALLVPNLDITASNIRIV